MTRRRSEAAMRALGGRAVTRTATVPMATAVSPFDEILGDSQVMMTAKAAVRDVVRRLMDLETPPPIFIVGESGTGKRSIARALHSAGPRRSGPFIDGGVGVVPDELLELELFGFERDAFRSARRTPGLVHEAHGGTLVLKDFDRLPPRLAHILLDVVRHRVVRRLKASAVEPADIALVATSHTSTSVFRPFGSIVLTMPPLRERGDDVLILARYYLAHFGSEVGLPPKTLSANAEAALRAHTWPDNLWSLRHEMERATILIEPQELEPEDFIPPAWPV
jgi:DNA-binding NtrC family response regulator